MKGGIVAAVVSNRGSRSGDESEPRDQELEVPTPYELTSPEARGLMRSLTASQAVNREAVCCGWNPKVKDEHRWANQVCLPSMAALNDGMESSGDILE